MNTHSAENPPDSFWTLGEKAEIEIKVQRSRFLAHAGPVTSPEQARSFIKEVRKVFHDARHVAHGWRLGWGNQAQENRNDDGEPSGTAGEPILAAIRQSELTDLVVTVVRYFGGIKLGTGGLSRAYGGAAVQVLAGAPRQEILLGREFELRFPYANRKTVQHLLDRHGGRVESENYGEEIKWRLWLPHSTWRDFLAALTEASGGTLNPEPCQPPGR